MNQDEFSEGLRTVQMLPHGKHRFESAKKLWLHSEASASPAKRFDSLSEVLHSAMFSGSVDFFLASFPRLAKMRKEHPDVIRLDDYVWRCKWLVENLPDFPEIPLERIDQAVAHLSETLRESGVSQRTALYHKWRNAVAVGRLEQADRLAEEFSALPTDRFADCEACEISQFVCFALARGDLPTALKKGIPITSGRVRCMEIPHLTLARLVVPLFCSGERDLAEVYHRKGVAMIRGNPNFLGSMGRHFQYLAATGQADRFLRLLRNYLPWLELNRTPSDVLEFCTGAAAGCRAVAAAKGGSRILNVTPPSGFAPDSARKSWTAQDLGELLTARAESLAESFDRRNGNRFVSESVRFDLPPFSTQG